VPADRDCPAAPLAIPPHPAPAAPAAAVPRPATAKPRSGAASTPVVTVSVKKRRTLSLKPE
jgi:hypothetical protein